MKSYILLPTILLALISCSDKSAKFAGTWQQTDDVSKQITILQTGKTFTFETNLESPFEGVPGTYNSDKKTLDFDNGSGTTVSFLFNDISQHILALGQEFEKTSDATADLSDDTEAEPMAETMTDETTEPTPSASADETEKSTSCGKGNLLVIGGNNVRVRNEPDITKQNILFQVHKGFEVVHQGDKTVDGQKWYKVCYEGNIGWVSGQYAAKK